MGYNMNTMIRERIKNNQEEERLPQLSFQMNSASEEREQVLRTIKRLEFYRKNNYKSVALPRMSDGQVERYLAGKMTEEDEKALEEQINKDSTLPECEEALEVIINNWQKMEQKFFEECLNTFKLKPKKEYKVFLTNYGAGGSYGPPDKVIVRNNPKNYRAFTVGHEIIHLMIHEFIEKYKIKHWTKERLVDLYMKKIFSDYQMQGLHFEKELIDKIDKIFEENFSDGPEAVISKI